MPDRFGVVPMNDPLDVEWLRTADYAAYHRRARAEFAHFMDDGARHGSLSGARRALQRLSVGGSAATTAGATTTICRSWRGITRRQRMRLVDHGVARLTALASAGGQRVEGVRVETLARLREQARLQVEGRRAGKVLHELLTDTEPGAGLESLPEPSHGDVFLDLEGDPHLKGRGLDYLFGLLELDEEEDYFGGAPRKGPPAYHAFWAKDPAEERRAFEQCVDRIEARLAEYANMHVYHFGHRENAALKQLANRHGTRVEIVDRWLSRLVLVDLHRAVRQGIRASVETYSLKELEPLWSFTRRRRSALRSARCSISRWRSRRAPPGWRTTSVRSSRRTTARTASRRCICAIGSRRDAPTSRARAGDRCRARRSPSRRRPTMPISASLRRESPAS